MPHEIQQLNNADTARLIGTLEASLPDTVGTYMKFRGTPRAIDDLERLWGLESQGKPAVFVGLEIYKSPYVKRLPVDEEITALLDAPFGIESNFALLSDRLPAPDDKSIDAVSAGFPLVTKTSIQTFTQFAEFFTQLPYANRMSKDKTVGALLMQIGSGSQSDAGIYSVDQLLGFAVKKIIHDVNFKTTEYHHMGPSEFDNHVGYHETNLEKYRAMVAPLIGSFEEEYRQVVSRFNLEEAMRDLIEKALTFPGKTRYEYAHRP
jgi:hypothetical protein